MMPLSLFLLGGKSPFSSPISKAPDWNFNTHRTDRSACSASTKTQSGRLPAAHHSRPAPAAFLRPGASVSPITYQVLSVFPSGLTAPLPVSSPPVTNETLDQDCKLYTFKGQGNREVQQSRDGLTHGSACPVSGKQPQFNCSQLLPQGVWT